MGKHYKSIIYSLFLNCVAIATQAPLWAQNTSTTDPLQAALKDALIESENRLGLLEPWQRAVFLDEVLPQSARFVKAYRKIDSGYQVDVDLDGIKKYLIFQSPKTEKQKAAVLLQADPTCAEACVPPLEGIKKIIKARLERRGFIVHFLSPESFNQRQGAELEDAVRQWGNEKKFGVLVVLQWKDIAVDSIDTTHIEDKKTMVRSFWNYQLPVGEIKKELTIKSELEVAAPETIETGAQRLLNESIAELGQKIRHIQLAESESKLQEIWISLKGLNDYSKYSQWKALLTERLEPLGQLEDRLLKRGQITFALLSDASPQGVVKVLSELSMDNQRLVIHGVNQNQTKIPVAHLIEAEVMR